MSRPADLKMGDIVYYTNRDGSDIAKVIDPLLGTWIAVDRVGCEDGIALNLNLTSVRRLTDDERLAYEAGRRDARREAER